MKRLSAPFFLVPLILSGASPILSLQARAEVSLPKVFSSHMVLQRNLPIHVWGQAAPGEQITVDLQGSAAKTTTTQSATTDDLGLWSVYLPPRPAGGPFTLAIHGQNTIVLDDLLIGDLWLASGQSNMEMPLAGFPGKSVVTDSAKEIAQANYPRIRLLRVEQDASEYPLEDLKAVAGWSLCTPEIAKDFSAVAYFFARDLQKKENIPIGLIDSSWGGTPAEAWISMNALGADAALMPVFSTRAENMDKETNATRRDLADKQAIAQGKSVPAHGWHPSPGSWSPSALYNAMIAPFTPLPIRGVLWYQGESNTGPDMAPLYSRLFPAMIADWRRQWHQGNFPFLFVQISAFGTAPDSLWSLVRDAQRRSLSLVNTGMAVTIDIGDEHNVHPANKQAVGQRLALLARSLAYGEDVVASGPLFRLAYPDHGAMHVWFDDARGLKTPAAGSQGFEVAGSDGVFVPATTTLDGDTILARSPGVPNPRYVRYAWPSFPHADLSNAAGLPASTFTSYPVP